MALDMYNSLSDKELSQLAIREGLKGAERYSREELEEILEEIWEDKLAERKQNNDIMRLKGKKYNIYREDFNGHLDTQEFIIPEKYPNTAIQLLLRDPFWAFAYWDINQFDLQAMVAEEKSPHFFLRVYELETAADSPMDAVSSFEIPVTAEDTSWYINLPNPGRWYQVDLIYQDGDADEILLTRSQVIESPGGYMLSNKDKFRKDPDAFKLFLAGFADISDHVVDNTLIQRILSGIENPNSSGGDS